MNEKAERQQTPSPQPPQAKGDLDERRLRHRRIAEYRAQSLAKSDPLAANIASANSDLFEMGDHLAAGLREAMSSGALTTEELPSLQATLEQVLRLNKQIERFAQLEIRLEMAKRQLKAAATDVGSSEHT